MCVEQIYSKEGITQSLNSVEQPLESLWDVASIPKDLFGKKKLDLYEKITEVKLLEGDEKEESNT